jgi:lipopolysaccharide/colanic/teichoic acid biosynthesis glycosyltransferase
MKVLFINRYYAPDQSGTSRILAELAQDLARVGMGVTVVTSDGDTADPGRRYPKRERLDGVAVSRVPIWRFSRGSILGWVLNSVSFYPMALLRALRLRHHDIVVLMSDPPLLQALGPAMRLFTRARLVCWCQDLYPEVAVALGILRERSFPALILTALSRWSLRRADRVVAIGDGMAERLCRHGIARERIELIGNWADGEAITPIPFEQNPFVQRHGFGEKFVVLYSGNLGVGHHFETIVEAAKRLRSVDQLQFLFIGAGKRRAWLMEQMRSVSTAHFLPPQPESALAQSLGGGHVHLVTLQPGLEGVVVPSKLYSALAAGRAVLFIGPPASEAARLIEKAGCGYVIAPGDAYGLANALMALMRSPGMVQRMGENGRRVFEQSFERRNSTRAFARLLFDVDGRPARVSMLKRAFDVVLSGLGLMASAPLWALFAALIWFEDRGPVFFHDRRVGRGGREFGVLKFRTMVPDADARFGPLQAREGDSRVTRVGRWLRATAMDELPQLWNIFTGEMSFVGPRALRPVEVEVGAALVGAMRGGAMNLFEIPGARARLAVQPGLTGLAQVYAPRDLPRAGKFRYDHLYVRRISLRLDFSLLLRSFWITVTGSWERRRRPFRVSKNGHGGHGSGRQRRRA